MKSLRICLFSNLASALLASSALAVDWEAARRTPAEITVVNCEAVPLTAGQEKGSFLKLPPKLEGAVVFKETDGKKAGNTADFTVVKEGYLFVAAHYGYQGNSQGDWDEKRWTEATFKKNGWEELPSKKLGGPLIDHSNNEWKVFAKRVRPKDSTRLVVNKYGPPKLIVLTGPKKP